MFVKQIFTKSLTAKMEKSRRFVRILQPKLNCRFFKIELEKPEFEKVKNRSKLGLRKP